MGEVVGQGPKWSEADTRLTGCAKKYDLLHPLSAMSLDITRRCRSRWRKIEIERGSFYL
jgi:hypothetical protein